MSRLETSRQNIDKMKKNMKTKFNNKDSEENESPQEDEPNKISEEAS